MRSISQIPDVQKFPSLYVLIRSPERREFWLFGGALIIILNAYYKVHTKLLVYNCV